MWTSVHVMLRKMRLENAIARCERLQAKQLGAGQQTTSDDASETEKIE